MLTNQVIFDVKFINQNNGRLVYYLSPQQVNALKMEKVINGISNLVLTVPYSDTIWNLYTLDLLVEVSTLNHDTMLLEAEETFFLRKRQVYDEDNYKQIAFFGVGLTDLVKRRVVKPTNLDNTTAGGYVTKAGNASDVFEEFVNEQMITPDNSYRGFPNLTFTKVSDGQVVGVRTRYENLFDIFEKIRVNGKVSYRITRGTSGDLNFEVGELWTDRTYTTNFPSNPYLLFSPELGNIDSPFFEENDIDTANVIFTLGEGEGSNQKVLQIQGLNIAASVYNRIEKTIESRKGSPSLGSANQQALTAGLKELEEQRTKRKVNFGVLENRVGFQYRVDFDLGDLVTFYWRDIEVDFEIKSTTFTVDGNNITRELTLEIFES